LSTPRFARASRPEPGKASQSQPGPARVPREGQNTYFTKDGATRGAPRRAGARILRQKVLQERTRRGPEHVFYDRRCSQRGPKEGRSTFFTKDGATRKAPRRAGARILRQKVLPERTRRGPEHVFYEGWCNQRGPEEGRSTYFTKDDATRGAPRRAGARILRQKVLPERPQRGPEHVFYEGWCNQRSPEEGRSTYFTTEDAPSEDPKRAGARILRKMVQPEMPRGGPEHVFYVRKCSQRGPEEGRSTFFMKDGATREAPRRAGARILRQKMLPERTRRGPEHVFYEGWCNQRGAEEGRSTYFTTESAPREDPKRAGARILRHKVLPEGTRRGPEHVFYKGWCTQRGAEEGRSTYFTKDGAPTGGTGDSPSRATQSPAS
jgi:hypothetical protein